MNKWQIALTKMLDLKFVFQTILANGYFNRDDYYRRRFARLRRLLD